MLPQAYRALTIRYTNCVVNTYLGVHANVEQSLQEDWELHRIKCILQTHVYLTFFLVDHLELVVGKNRICPEHSLSVGRSVWVWQASFYE